jgi:uncharacterized protein involved in exopolysaccharide biosynthesis/Mrp family chromosome partitioning ATPase
MNRTGEIQPAEEHYDISIGDVIAFFLRYWPLLAVTTFACVCLAVAYLLVARPSYTATTQLLIETGQGQSLTQPLSEALITMDTPQIESQIALLKSAQIAEKVANKLGLFNQQHEDEEGHAAPGWLSRLFFGSAKPTDESSEASAEEAAKRAIIENIQNTLNVKRVGLSYVLDVSYRAATAQAAAQTANAISDAYVRDKLETRARAAQEGSAWLEERIEKLRHLMNQAALDEQEFKARRDYRLPPRYDRQRIGEDIDKENSKPADNSLGAPAGQSQQIGSGTETPESAALTLDELESRAQTYRKIYESYLQTYTDTVQRESYPMTNARVISRADPPKVKSGPRSLFVLAVAIVFGLISGSGLALAHSTLDQTVRTRRQVEHKVGLVMLGEVVQHHALSHIPVLWRLEALWRKYWLSGRSHPNLTVVRDRPMSRISLELKRVALAIKAASSAQRAKVIGIVGCDADTDAAILAGNLALFAARSGTRTLLIDASLSAPKLASLAQGQSPFELKDVLSGTVAPKAAVLHAEDLAPATLLVTTTSPAHEWTTFESAKFAEAIGQLKDDFDVVLIRLPAISAGQDISPVDKTVDGVAIVCQAGVTTVQALKDLTSNLQMAGVSLLGIVIADLA